MPATTDAVEREPILSLVMTHRKRLRKRDKMSPPGDNVVRYDSAVRSRPYRGILPFDSKSVGEEIERARVRLEISVADITGKIGMPRTLWYKKIAGTPAFRWEEAAKLAREFQAPKGWPLVPWNEGLAWERHLEGGNNPR